MSYKTDLQSNNTDLQSILAKINALEPNAGGSVDTCSVELSVGWNITKLCYQAYSPEQGVYLVELTDLSTSYTMANVVCGSVVYLQSSGSSKFYSVTNGGVETFTGSSSFQKEHILHITAAKGLSTTVSFAW